MATHKGVRIHIIGVYNPTDLLRADEQRKIFELVNYVLVELIFKVNS